MSITLVTGTPGSGKSLSCVYDLLFDLKHGFPVITNFPVAPEKYFKKRRFPRCTYIPEEFFTVSSLISYARKYHKPRREHQTTIYLDEPDFLNPRNFDKIKTQRWCTFFRLHRKIGFDVVICTQSDILIDKQIQKYIEFEKVCRKASHYKTLGWILGLLTGGFFVSNTFWYGSRKREPLEHKFFLLHRRKAAVYDSFNLFGSFDDLLDSI